MNTSSLFGTVAACLLSGAVAVADVEYKYDDGAGNTNIGPNFAAEMLFGNVYTAQPGGEIITTIKVAWGSIPIGTSVTLALYDDPTDDGNPADCSLLTEVSGVADLPRTNTFLSYPITPTRVHGDFLVAVKVMVDGTSIRPARLDPQSIAFAGRAWIFADDDINDQNLDDSPYRLNMSQNVIQGAFLVRAEGTTAPACTGDLNADGVVDDTDFVTFAAAYELFDCSAPNMPVPCASDLNQDAFVDDADFVLFAAAYEQFVCP